MVRLETDALAVARLITGTIPLAGSGPASRRASGARLMGGLAAVLALPTLSACSAPLPRHHDLPGPWKDDLDTPVLRLSAAGACRAELLETDQGPVTGPCSRVIARGGGWPAVVR